MVTIMGALLGLISFLMGYGPIGLCFGIVCGLIADLILRAGGYKSLKCSVASHCVFSLWVIGTMLPMWILGQAYFEPYRASQGDAFVNESLGVPLRRDARHRRRGNHRLRAHWGGYRHQGSSQAFRAGRYCLMEAVVHQASPSAKDRGFWLDPRTKIAMLLCANVAFLTSGYTPTGFAIKFATAAVLTTLLSLARMRRAAVAFAVAYLAAFALEVANEAFLLEALRVRRAWPAVVLRFLTSMVLSFFPGTMFAYYLLASTKVSEFVAAFTRLRLPEKVVIPFAVIFRFFPTVAEEYRSIRDAMQLRGVNWKNGPVSMVEYRLVPLIASMVKIGDELSAASVTRGLGGPAKRTNRCVVGFGSADAAMVALMVVLAAAAMAKGAIG